MKSFFFTKGKILMDVGSWDCHTWWRSNILIYLIITLYHGDNSFLQTSIENETSLSNLTVLLLIFTTFIWIDSTKPIYYLRKQRMVSFIYMPTCDIYALVGKAWADLQIHTYMYVQTIYTYRPHMVIYSFYILSQTLYSSRGYSEAELS